MQKHTRLVPGDSEKLHETEEKVTHGRRDTGPEVAARAARPPLTPRRARLTPAEIDRQCAVMERRLRALLDTNPQTVRHLDHILEIGSIARWRPVHRLRLLLFIGAGVAAVRAGRLTPERLDRVTGAEFGADTPHSADGLYLERHRNLLSRLVWRGCKRRGEL